MLSILFYLQQISLHTECTYISELHDLYHCSKSPLFILWNQPFTRRQNFSFVETESICRRQVKCHLKH